MMLVKLSGSMEKRESGSASPCMKPNSKWLKAKVGNRLELINGKGRDFLHRIPIAQALRSTSVTLIFSRPIFNDGF